MKQLWCPWRLEYILGPKPDSCVFCISEHPQAKHPESAGRLAPEDAERFAQEDAERLVLYRGRKNFVIMNKYPYNNGHLMVTPYRHLMDICDLDEDERNELMLLLQVCTSILKSRFTPQGINIGLNLGAAAGAGIREHLHFHLVPRWNGDSSFMAVMDEIRVVPEHLASTYAALKPLFDAYAEQPGGTLCAT